MQKSVAFKSDTLIKPLKIDVVGNNSQKRVNSTDFGRKVKLSFYL